MIKLLLIFVIIIILFSVNTIDKTDKYTILKYFPIEYVPTVEIYDNQTDLELVSYPVIFKPNKCGFFGHGVEKINNRDDAIRYIQQFPYDNKNIIIQEFSPYKNEVAIFIRRSLNTNRLEIISAVTRDLQNDIVNNHCNEDKCHIITDDLSITLKDKIHEISNIIPGLNWGRYDIKFENKEELMKGNFHIMELNIGPGIFPILYPMNYDIIVLWNNSDPQVIYRIIEFIISYFIIGIVNIISGKIKINNIFININKWIQNISC
tara:strand:+ start:1011 stop:1799 length:789 start_codon:yes stop_codon:yes gene_type:complete